MGVAAVPADPHLLLFAGKDLALLEVGGEGAVTCLMLLFDLTHHREESGQLGEASSLASAAIRGYISVHSSFSPLAAISRQVMVSGIAPPQRALNHILACSFSLPAVSSKIAASCS